LPKPSSSHNRGSGKALTAKEAKKGFDRLIDIDRAVLMVMAKHSRLVVVVMAVEEFERLKALDQPTGAIERRQHKPESQQ
jgi:hypothetical protein